ncbi:hypothetical protein L2E82_45660 [Cichorium intybus]|uniref:Uncharacterized protein n=1 Tax=Cichorium intybus TaxID=13427 RepID=A0ACB8ZTY0_CICIN|nr:hypothetical protein L2E82_45660 [Cichorium intybus]
MVPASLFGLRQNPIGVLKIGQNMQGGTGGSDSRSGEAQGGGEQAPEAEYEKGKKPFKVKKAVKKATPAKKPKNKVDVWGIL